MTVRDKVSAIEFSVETGLDPVEIRQAASQAAESGIEYQDAGLSHGGRMDSWNCGADAVNQEREYAHLFQNVHALANRALLDEESCVI